MERLEFENKILDLLKKFELTDENVDNVYFFIKIESSKNPLIIRNKILIINPKWNRDVIIKFECELLSILESSNILHNMEKVNSLFIYLSAFEPPKIKIEKVIF